MDELLYKLASIVQFNNKAEAQAIEDYTEFLKTTAELNVPTATKEYIDETISEIVADELNHQQKLQELYSFLTQIEPNKD